MKISILILLLGIFTQVYHSKTHKKVKKNKKSRDFPVIFLIKKRLLPEKNELKHFTT